MAHDTGTVTAYIGRDRDTRDRVFAHITLRQISHAEPRETVTHETITDYTELSVTVSVYGYRSSSCVAAGQAREYLRDPRGLADHAGRWTAADIRSLSELWERWHLNGMRAACAHMTLPADTSYDTRRDIVCESPRVPFRRYAYGRAWLVEDLPAEVVAEVQRLQALPRGHVPDYVS
jgi:hypothetical protein